MDPDAAPSLPPRPLVVLIVIWIVSQIYIYFASRHPEIWPNDQPRGIAITIGNVLGFLYAFLLIALVSYGLMKAQRFVWAVAFVWQGVVAGHALVALSLMNYQLNDFPTFTGFPLWGIALPLTVAALSFVILLLPSTRSWINSD